MGDTASTSTYIGFGTAPDEGKGIIQTYYGIISVTNNQPIDFYFYAAWEEYDNRIKDRDEFFQLLEFESERLTNPILIKV